MPKRTWASASRSVRELAARPAALLAGTERKVLALLALLALAARWSVLDLARVDAPLLRSLLAGSALARGEAFPLVGAPTGLGLHHPPWLTYVLALPALVSRDPRLALGLVAGLNIAGLLGLFVTTRRYYGLRAACGAAILWLVNPWTGLHAQQASPAALLAPLAVVVLYGLLRGSVDRGPWGWALATAGLGAMVAVSLWALAVAPAFLIVLIVYHRRVAWAHALFGACIGLLLLSPWLYEGNLSRYTAVRQAVRGALGAEMPADDATAAAAPEPLEGEPAPMAEPETLRAPGVLDVVRHAHSGDGIDRAHGAPAPEVPGWPGAARLEALGGWLVVAGLTALWPLALSTWGHWRARRDPAIHLVPAVLAWGGVAALAIAARALAPLEPRTDHLAAVQPVGFLALGIVMDRLTRVVARPTVWRQRLATAASGALTVVLAAVVAWQGYAAFHAQRYAARRDVVSSGDGGEHVALPLHFWRTTADLLRRQAEDAGTSQVWLLCEGHPPESEAAILEYLLAGRPRLVTMGPGAFFLPAGRAGVYLSLGEHMPGGVGVGPVPAEDRGLVLSPGAGYEARVSVAEARDVGAALADMDGETDVALDGGLQVLGYDWPATAAAGEAVRLSTYWTFGDLSADERDHEHRVLVCLMADGAVVAESWGLGLPEKHWAEGYLLQRKHEMVLPDTLGGGEYTLAASVFRVGEAPAEPTPLGQVRVSSANE